MLKLHGNDGNLYFFLKFGPCNFICFEVSLKVLSSLGIQKGMVANFHLMYAIL